VQNPFISEFNGYLTFHTISSKQITQAASDLKQEIRTKRNLIVNQDPNTLTFNSVINALDELSHSMSLFLYPTYLMSSVHPEISIREAADAAVVELGKFGNELQLDEDMYNIVKAYSKTADAMALRGVKLKYVQETVRDYERNGFALPKEKRNELKTLQDKLADVTVKFHTNIAEAEAFIYISKDESSGLPEAYLKARIQEDGHYKIGLDYPSYVPFMKYAESDKRRKELYTLYLNRAKESNLPILKEILLLRKHVAELLGYKTYAAYGVENRMAKSPKNIWDFEYNLADQVKEKATLDYNALLAIKQTLEADAKHINNWEKAFLNNKLLQNKYQLNQEELQNYFELNQTINGMFTIVQDLFAVTFKEVKNADVWHDDVRLYEVIDHGQVVGRFYTDLFPRENKYGHAACFGLVSGRQTHKGYVIPTAGLVCNFTKPSSDQPSLLTHNEVETLFHEFGHVLHSVLTTSEFHAYSGTSVVRDFVETPSQLMENWCWNFKALSRFAKHYKTGETLPKDLFEKLLSTKQVGSGIDTQQQLFYGILDMTLYDGYDPNGNESTTDIVERLQNKFTLFNYVKGTHFEASFGHLDGYAAGYYGYLWSKVYAQDIFSEFEKTDIFNKELGQRLKEEIYQKGGSADELGMVRAFLKREPSSQAFIKMLGLES
jgi:thimet oligopeptidase